VAGLLGLRGPIHVMVWTGFVVNIFPSDILLEGFEWGLSLNGFEKLCRHCVGGRSQSCFLISISFREMEGEEYT
jgi:hypothetical protein